MQKYHETYIKNVIVVTTKIVFFHAWMAFFKQYCYYSFIIDTSSWSQSNNNDLFRVYVCMEVKTSLNLINTAW